MILGAVLDSSADQWQNQGYEPSGIISMGDILISLANCWRLEHIARSKDSVMHSACVARSSRTSV